MSAVREGRARWLPERNISGGGAGPVGYAPGGTSSENIGFLDGAVETGAEAAKTLLRRLRW